MQLGCSRWCGGGELGYCDEPTFIVNCKIIFFNNIIRPKTEDSFFFFFF